jgi:SAM-dependent methyltransferase
MLSRFRSFTPAHTLTTVNALNTLTALFVKKSLHSPRRMYGELVSATTATPLGSRISQRLFVPGVFDFVFNPLFLIRRPVFQFVKDQAPHFEGSVLDFGCGSMPFKHLFTGVDTYTGLDLEDSQHGLSKPDVVFDGVTIPFPDRHFDAVISFEVVDDLKSPTEQLREIHRVLKPGGRLMLTTSFVWELHEEPHDIARYTPHGLENLLKESGFDVIMQSTKGHYARVLGQMSAMYWYQTLQKLPLGVLPGVAIAGLIQLTTLLTEHLLPKRRELYLSNLVVAEKARD